MGAATAKLREPKHVRTWGTSNKLESDERSDGKEHIVSLLNGDRAVEW